MKGWMYILECSDGSYYTGSTNNLELRIEQHQNGEGAKHTKKRLPVKLLYFEEFKRIDEAFYREKQIQGWSRKKKEALINGNGHQLSDLSLAYRDVASRASATVSKNSAIAWETSVTDSKLLEAASEENQFTNLQDLDNKSKTTDVVSNQTVSDSHKTLREEQETFPKKHEALPEAFKVLPEALEGKNA